MDCKFTDSVSVKAFIESEREKGADSQYFAALADDAGRLAEVYERDAKIFNAKRMSVFGDPYARECGDKAAEIRRSQVLLRKASERMFGEEQKAIEEKRLADEAARIAYENDPQREIERQASQEWLKGLKR